MQSEQDSLLDKDLFALKNLLEQGAAVEDLSDDAIEKVHKYLFVHQHGSVCRVSFNEKAIAEKKKSH